MSALISHAQQAAGNVGSQLQRTAGSVGNQLQTTTDRFLPPKQREQKIKELRAFANRNPKLATFLAAQTALLAVPLFLFLSFAFSTLFISLSTSILFAITTAFIYTFLAVGIAVLFLVPTLFIASCAASCFFLWGLAVYFILQRLNEGQAPAKPGTRVGDKLHGLTGGRLEWMVDGQDEQAVEVSQTQDVANTTGSKGPQKGDWVTRQGGDEHVTSNEWETKWANGAQRQKDLANGIDLKRETVALHPIS